MNKNIIALFAYLYLIYNYSKCCNTTKAVITITFILVLTLNNIDGLNVGSPVQGADDQIDIPVKPGVQVQEKPLTKSTQVPLSCAHGDEAHSSMFTPQSWPMDPPR